MPMKPNKYDERNRWYRKLEKERIEAWKRIRKPEYVPLEKPYAMGWNIYLDVHPNCKMDDYRMGILREIVGMLNLKRVYFTRKVDVVKYFRKYKYNYSNVVTYAQGEEIFIDHYHKYDALRWQTIGWKAYNSLPEHLKKYFVPSMRCVGKVNGEMQYRMRGMVNLGAFNYSHNINDYVVVRVKRAYATKRAIPDSEAQSTYRKNTDILSSGGYFGYRYNWRLDGLPKPRKKWKGALRAVARLKDYNDYWGLDLIDPDMTEEEQWNLDLIGDEPRNSGIVSYSDLEEEILVKHKIFKHKY